MSTLVMNEEPKKAAAAKSAPKETGRFRRALWLALIAAACIAIDNLYALFGHGVRSDAMTFMFCYPLGGAAFYLILGAISPQAVTGLRGRLGVNLTGSGVATLTVGAFLEGIVEIAGSSTAYLPVFTATGWAFVAAGAIALFVSAVGRPL